MRLGSHRREFVYFAILAAFCVSSGCAPRNAPRALGPVATLEVRLVSATSVPNAQPATDSNSGTTVYLMTPPVITAADVATIQRSDTSSQTPSLTVTLTPAGANKLAAATTPATGQKLAVVTNGKVISVATVHAPLSTNFKISGGVSPKEQEQIFEMLTKY